LEILNLDQNPVIKKDNFREKVIAANVNFTLRVINTADVTIDERIRSIIAFGSKQQKQDLGPIRWDLHISKLPEVLSMQTGGAWRPEYIKKLEIMNANLSVFHVGDMRYLEHLDLSGNKISDIRGTGIEQCDKLGFLNLRGLNFKNYFIY
jgi:hypothetical protein